MGTRWMVFGGLALFLGYGSPMRLFRSIPGDPGDAHLILALLEWGADRSSHLYSGYWDGPMFSAGRDVMAYSDTFLPLTVPFKAIELVSGSSILAFNLLYLASWVLCGEATFRLARRLVHDDRAALVGAVAFTFSTIRLTSTNHFQLAWAGLIPLGFLLFFRFRDRPTPGRGVLLAAALVCQFLTSAYYGMFLIVGIGVLTAVGLVRDVQAGRVRGVLVGHAALGTSMIAMLLPIQHWYSSARDCAGERHFDVAHTALRPQNFLSAPEKSVFLGDAPLIGSESMVNSTENHAYVGVVVIVACVGLLAWVLRRRRPPPSLRRLPELVAIAAVGAAVAAVAAGPLDHPFPVPFDLAEAVVPGMNAIGALGRFAVFVQLPLALITSVALAMVFQDRSRSAVVATSIALVGVIALEGLMHQPMVDVPEADAGSVYDVLAGLEPGVAVELPMPPSWTVFPFAYIEATRMALGADDDVQTVNGYSGHVPADYDATVDVLNSFPMPGAVEELRALGVDYLVLHDVSPDTGSAAFTRYVAASGFAAYEPAALDARLLALPLDLVDRQVDATDGVVLVLRPGPEVSSSVACDRS